MTLYVRKWAHERRPDATFDPSVAAEWRKDTRILSETSVHEFIERTPLTDNAQALLSAAKDAYEECHLYGHPDEGTMADLQKAIAAASAQQTPGEV